MNEYLPLTDYSTKYKVSISTLRRKIKMEDIRYVFEEGRYLILDEPPSTHQRRQSPSRMATTNDEALVSAPVVEQEPIFTAANRLLTELKKAYTQILQEKEEQILQLKEEVSDLKTLVRVLESDNERAKLRS